MRRDAVAADVGGELWSYHPRSRLRRRCFQLRRPRRPRRRSRLPLALRVALVILTGYHDTGHRCLLCRIHCRRAMPPRSAQLQANSTKLDRQWTQGHPDRLSGGPVRRDTSSCISFRPCRPQHPPPPRSRQGRLLPGRPHPGPTSTSSSLGTTYDFSVGRPRMFSGALTCVEGLGNPSWAVPRTTLDASGNKLVSKDVGVCCS